MAKYAIANRYITISCLKDETHDGEGIEIVKNERIKNGDQESQYTYQIYHFKSRIPKFIRWAVPDKYLHFHEESWDTYPYYKTLDRVPGLGEKFGLDVESQHIPYKYGQQIPYNALNLSKDELAHRKIWYLDIVDQDPDGIEKNYNLEGFSCPQCGIEKMQGKKGSWSPHNIPEWVKTYKGEMICCIKVVKFHLKWWGIQKAVEKLVTQSVFPKLFVGTHRKMVGWVQNWYNLSMDDVLKMEQEVMAQQQGGKEFEKD